MLLPFEILYFFGVSTKLLAYKIGIFRQKKVTGVKIICVGNLSAGGTGKTPTVLHLLQELQKSNEKIAVVSRGYKKGKSEQFNDEGSMINAMFPEVLQFQNPDRYSACVEAKNAGATVIILDDGFSHLKLARDIDIVLIDATRPFSNFELLPRGLLREPLNSLKRASGIIITRSDQVDPEKLRRLRCKIEKYMTSDAKIMLASHEPVSFSDIFESKTYGVNDFKGKKAVAFAGIGNPKSFKETCEEIGLETAEFIEFADHHSYSQSEIEDVINRAKEVGAEIIVTTSKDAVKISKLPMKPNLPMFALEIKFMLNSEDDEKLKKLLGF